MIDAKESAELEMTDKRSTWIDILRALLIITVVIGHSNVDARMIQIIFWFHMPLFFVLSGYLLHMPQKDRWQMWGIKKAIRLLIPCLSFFILCSLADGNLNFSSFACFVMGGKRQAGVYWFATVLFLAEIVVATIELYISSGKIKFGIYGIFFGMAVLESAVLIPADTAQIPDYLKLPWNIDVVPLAMAYLAIGYYGGKFFADWMQKKNLRYKILLTGAAVVIMGLFSWSCWKGDLAYHLDMKNGHYSNPVLALLLPAAAGVIFTAGARLLSKIKGLSDVLAYVGKASMTVMYLHILLIGQVVKRIYGEGYPILPCLAVVLLISCLFHYLAGKNKWISLVFLGRYVKDFVASRRA